MTSLPRRRLLTAVLLAVSLVAFAPAAGSQPREKLFFWEPAWSHDGRQIALVGLTEGYDRSYLLVMNADGTNLHQIDTTGLDQHPSFEQRIGSPTWSPRDDRIAFWAGPDAQGNPSLWRINSAGGGLIRLVFERRRHHLASSDDGDASPGT